MRPFNPFNSRSEPHGRTRLIRCHYLTSSLTRGANKAIRGARALREHNLLNVNLLFSLGMEAIQWPINEYAPSILSP